MTSPLNREEETKQKLKVLVLNFAKGYVRDGDMEKELEAMKWAEEFIDQYAQQVAIEARIDEFNLVNQLFNEPGSGITPKWAGIAIRDRLIARKSELEKERNTHSINTDMLQ